MNWIQILLFKTIINIPVLVSVFLFSSKVIAQTTNSTYSEFRPEREKELYLRIETSSFFDNYEYSSPHVKGQTLIGAWGRIKGEYYPARKLRIQAGINAHKYSGSDQFSEISDWLSFVYKPNDIFSLTMGNIDLQTEISLPAPIYSPERYNTTPNHKGLQAKLQLSRLSLSSFLDWVRFISEKENSQEMFYAGFQAKIKPLSTITNIDVEIPLLLTGMHSGGEFGRHDMHIESVLNANIGLNLILKHKNSQYNFENSIFLYNDVTHNKQRPIEQGFGLSTQLKYSLKQVRTKLQYWYSNNYIAPLGHNIYQSYTQKIPTMLYKIHSLISAHGSYVLTISDIANLIVEAEYIYDLTRKKNNFFTGLKLVISDEFFLYKKPIKHISD